MRSLKSCVLLAALSGLPGPLLGQDDTAVFHSSLAEDWYRGGSTFEWTSTVAGNHGAQVSVFYRTFGETGHPQLLLLHGFPNSSIDYYRLIPLLEADYRIAVLDFPGSCDECCGSCRP